MPICTTTNTTDSTDIASPIVVQIRSGAFENEQMPFNANAISVFYPVLRRARGALCGPVGKKDTRR